MAAVARVDVRTPPLPRRHILRDSNGVNDREKVPRCSSEDRREPAAVYLRRSRGRIEARKVGHRLFVKIPPLAPPLHHLGALRGVFEA